jgi:hypothetical protein
MFNLDTFEPTYLNVEYLFFLVYRLFKGILNFFKGLFTGFSGDSKFLEFYRSTGGEGNCNPFLGDVCSSAFSSSSSSSSSLVSNGAAAFGAGLRVFLILLIILLLCAIIYSYREWKKIQEKSDKHIENLIPIEAPEERENKRWKHVQELIVTNNPNDWRMAVLEADSMLEDLTIAMNIPGDSLGERLKSIEPSDFLTLQNAWEGHKVRNQIAHQGSGFVLDHKTAQTAIKNFEAVFREFEVI